MGRLELFHFLAEEEGEVELFNGMLDAGRVGDAIEALVVEPAEVAARIEVDVPSRKKREVDILLPKLREPVSIRVVDIGAK